VQIAAAPLPVDNLIGSGKMKPWSYFMHRTLAAALEEIRAA
jgi:hypothetical protein